MKKVNLIILGNSIVGKTTILSSYGHLESNHRATVGIDCIKTTYKYTKVILWDT